MFWEFCILICFCLHLTAAKLSEVRVLLPYTGSKTKNVRYKIKHLEGHCCEWYTLHPNIATVEYEGPCAKEATIIAVSTYAETMETVLFAKDDQGFSMDCDVIVDVVDRIEMATTTRVLHVGEVEKYYVHAFDKTGNIFSSLSGLEFNWWFEELTSKSEGWLSKRKPVIEITNKFANKFGFNGNVYPDAIGRDDSDVFGYSVEFTALSSGTVKINSKILEKVYENVNPMSVVINVNEPFKVIPNFLFTLPKNRVEFKVMRKEKGGEYIGVAADYYDWFSKNEDIFTVSTQKGFIDIGEIGESDLIVSETGMPNNTQIAKIHVVYPHLLRFELFEIVGVEEMQPVVLTMDKYFLQVGKQYVWTINIFGKEDKLLTNDMVVFEYEIVNENLFEKVSATKNNSYHVLNAVEKGKADLTAQFDYCAIDIVKNCSSYTLSLNQPVVVVEQIAVNPDIVFLPKPGSQFSQVKVNGGTSCCVQIDRSSGESATATNNMISNQECACEITVVSDSFGLTGFRVEDKIQKSNFAILNVNTISPTRIEFQPHGIQYEVNSLVTIPINVYGMHNEKEVLFHNCSELNLKFEPDNAVIEIVSLTHGSAEQPGCLFAKFRINDAGKSAVKGLFHISDEDVIVDETIIYGFKPLRIVEPINPTISCGSTVELVVEGGPSTILERDVFAEALPDDLDSLSGVFLSTFDDIHKFRVRCLRKGEHKISVLVGKQIKKYTVTTTLYCENPNSIEIVHTEMEKPCKDHNFYLQKATQHLFGVKVRNAAGKEFYNSSSFEFYWESQNQDMVTFSSPTESQLATKTSDGHAIIEVCFHNNYRSNLRLESCLSDNNNYNDDSNKINEQKLCTKAKVYIVNSISILSKQDHVFRHNYNRPEIQILGGSGFFRISRDDGLYTSIELDTREKLLAPPMYDRLVHFQVEDTCLKPMSRDSLYVDFRKPHRIETTGLHKVEIGNSTTIFLRVFDENNKAFSATQLRAMTITAKTNEKLGLTIEKLAASTDKSMLLYKVIGEELGNYTIDFEIHSNGLQQNFDFEVIEKMLLIPERINLIVGDVFQLHWNVYNFDKTIKFTTGDQYVVQVHPTKGLLTGIEEGETTVYAELFIGGHGDDAIPISRSSVLVTVKRLRGIKIQSGSNTLLVNQETILHIEGNDGTTPITFGSSGIKFRWTVSHPSLLPLQSPYKLSGSRKSAKSESDNYDLSMFAKPKYTGPVTVMVNSVHPVNRELNALQFSKQFNIIEQLYFKYKGEISCDKRVKMSVGSEFVVKTNKDDNQNAQCSYHILDESSTISVSKTGVIRAGNFESSGAVIISCIEFDLTLREVVLVEVMEIALISIHPNHPTILPLTKNQPILWPIKIRNIKGEEFDSISKKIEFETSLNYHDTVQVTTRFSSGSEVFLELQGKNEQKQTPCVLELCVNSKTNENVKSVCTYIDIETMKKPVDINEPKLPQCSLLVGNCAEYKSNACQGKYRVCNTCKLGYKLEYNYCHVAKPSSTVTPDPSPESDIKIDNMFKESHVQCAMYVICGCIFMFIVFLGVSNNYNAESYFNEFN